MLSKKLKQELATMTANDPGREARLQRVRVYFKIALQISSLRKSKGLTQAELAKKVETTQPNIARWETPGYDRYSISRLLDISEALGTELEIKFVDNSIYTKHLTWKLNDEEIKDYEMLRRIRATPHSNHSNTFKSYEIIHIGA